MGGMLKAVLKHPAGRKPKSQLQTATNLPPTFDDIGIKKTAAHRHLTTSQRAAKMMTAKHGGDRRSW